jgi:hypothetical protein
MMPGMGGLATLAAIKEIDPGLSVVLVTKSEEERLMEEAIGKRIDDYLVKPVNPSQIVLALKRLLDARKIQEGRFTRDYVSEFNRVQSIPTASLDADGWVDLFARLSELEVELFDIPDTGLKQPHLDLKQELNVQFAKFIEGNYRDWLHAKERPRLSHDIVPWLVAPLLREGKRVYLIIIDCMRLDQWIALSPMLEDLFEIRREHFYSILPSATPYSRNGIFSGLLPVEIARDHRAWWQETVNDERSKNRYEKDLLEAQLARLSLADRNFKYVKIYNVEEGNALRRQISTYSRLPLVAFVFNFMDILAHGRSESNILQELAPDEAAFRSVIRSWFSHSALFDILKSIAAEKASVVLTTDHGSVLGKRAALVYGNRETSTNLRYKYGSNLAVDPRQALHVKNPEDYFLPNEGLNKNYIFAKEDFYFVYPTKFHEYERQYRGSFQHGGISMEEMILPAVTLTPRG